MKLIHGRYRIIETIGRDSFGDTYLTIDEAVPSRRKCVVRQLKPQYGVITPDMKERFEQEALVLEKLGNEHNGIPKLFAYFEEGGEFYLVQEYVPGKTLKTLIEEQKMVNEGDVRKFLLEILPTLEFIHSKKIIHRDIKPDNIIIRESDLKPVLIDFGLVNQMTDSERVSMALGAGTVGYMALEQLRGNPTKASDIYSLGMTAIAMLTNGAKIDSDPVTGKFEWRKYIVTKMTERLGLILDKATEFRIGDRYQSAKEMLEDLEGGQIGISVKISNTTNSLGLIIPMPGDLLALRYQVIKPLGKDGGQHSFFAFDKLYEQYVVIKSYFRPEGDLMKALSTEIRAWLKINHPNIPQPIDVFEIGSQLFTVVKFIPGKDLGERLVERMESHRKAFPADLVLRWMKSLLKTLHYLHSYSPKIIHGDIRPQNLIGAPNGELFLLGLGFNDKKIKEGIFLESPYIPQEQLRGDPIDERADLYSVGATMFHLLSGRVPPSPRTLMPRLGFIPIRTDPSLAVYSPEIAGYSFSSVIARALSYNRDNRPQSSAEMWELLFHERPFKDKAEPRKNFKIIKPGSNEEIDPVNEFNQLTSFSPSESIPVIDVFPDNFPVQMVSNEIYLKEKNRCARILNKKMSDFDFACLEARFLGGSTIKDFIARNGINQQFNLVLLFESKILSANSLRDEVHDQICLILIYNSGAIRTKAARVKYGSAVFKIEINDSRIFFDPDEETSNNNINDFFSRLCIVPFYGEESLSLE